MHNLYLFLSFFFSTTFAKKNYHLFLIIPFDSLRTYKCHLMASQRLPLCMWNWFSLFILWFCFLWTFFPFAYKMKSGELLFSLFIAKKRLRKYSSIYLCRWVLVDVYLQCNPLEINEIFFLSAPKTWHFIYVHSGFNAYSFL